VVLLNYRDLELKISKESPNLYCASALENGSTAASHAFELRSGELRVSEAFLILSFIALMIALAHYLVSVPGGK